MGASFCDRRWGLCNARQVPPAEVAAQAHQCRRIRRANRVGCATHHQTIAVLHSYGTHGSCECRGLPALVALAIATVALCLRGLAPLSLAPLLPLKYCYCCERSLPNTALLLSSLSLACWAGLFFFFLVFEARRNFQMTSTGSERVHASAASRQSKSLVTLEVWTAADITYSSNRLAVSYPLFLNCMQSLGSESKRC